MPRQRLHYDSAKRQAEYRKRQAAQRKEIQRMQSVDYGRSGIDAQQSPAWFAVKLSVELLDNRGIGEINYVLSGSELTRLRKDLDECNRSKAVKNWTYAVADTDGFGIPGTSTLHLTGITVKDSRELRNYVPPTGYRIHESSVALMRMNEMSYSRTVPEQVADFLRTKKPGAYCDKCIHDLLALSRPQQAQQATSALGTSGAFDRQAGICANCHEQRLVTRAL